MSRSKPPEYIRKRREKAARITPANTPARSLTRKLVELFGITGTLASIVGILAFLPRISIEAQGSIRAHDPFGTVFYLSNDSILPIHDISVLCGLDHLRQPGTMAENLAYDDPSLHAKLLSPGQKMTLNCHSAFTTKTVAHS